VVPIAVSTDCTPECISKFSWNWGRQVVRHVIFSVPVETPCGALRAASRSNQRHVEVYPIARRAPRAHSRRANRAPVAGNACHERGVSKKCSAARHSFEPSCNGLVPNNAGYGFCLTRQSHWKWLAGAARFQATGRSRAKRARTGWRARASELDTIRSVKYRTKN
jgi:hypothetical protein